jgi:hypothetical protein
MIYVALLLNLLSLVAMTCSYVYIGWFLIMKTNYCFLICHDLSQGDVSLGYKILSTMHCCFYVLQLDRKSLSIAIRFLKAKTPEQRAAVDLDTHYSKDYLEESVGTNTRRAILYQQYVKGISETGMQSKYGFDGQINACWLHKITKVEIELIRSAGFLVSVIHGRHDVIAQICYARRLAQRLYPVARMVDLHGGHLVSHERTEEVLLSYLARS